MRPEALLLEHSRLAIPPGTVQGLAGNAPQLLRAAIFLTHGSWLHLRVTEILPAPSPVRNHQKRLARSFDLP